jgi:hypothetical protein
MLMMYPLLVRDFEAFAERIEGARASGMPGGKWQLRWSTRSSIDGPRHIFLPIGILCRAQAGMFRL